MSLQRGPCLFSDRATRHVFRPIFACCPLREEPAASEVPAAPQKSWSCRRSHGELSAPHLELSALTWTVSLFTFLNVLDGHTAGVHLEGIFVGFSVFTFVCVSCFTFLFPAS